MRAYLIASTFALAAGCYNPDLGDVGFYCHPDDSPACPDGSTCTMSGGDYRCVRDQNTNNNGGLPAIPKTSNYTGVHNDPQLNDAASCPDAALEPNDTLDQAKVFAVTPDNPSTPKLVKLAICPKGAKDADVFRVDVTGTGLTMMAEIFYDVTYGDLDVAILDNTGRILSADGSAVANGCTVSAVTAGTYFVAIQGANNMDVNRYDARIRLFSTTKTCPVM